DSISFKVGNSLVKSIIRAPPFYVLVLRKTHYSKGEGPFSFLTENSRHIPQESPVNILLILVEMHSIKTVITFLYLLLSTFVFVVYGEINWIYAFVLAIGTGIGGWIGSRFAISISEKFLRITMTIVILLMAIKLLFF